MSNKPMSDKELGEEVLNIFASMNRLERYEQMKVEGIKGIIIMLEQLCLRVKKI